MASNAKRHLTATWRGPKSVCTCGHLGDGSDSEHDGSISMLQDGHGACRVKGCNCKQFTWRGWSERFHAALDQLDADAEARGEWDEED